MSMLILGFDPGNSVMGMASLEFDDRGENLLLSHESMDSRKANRFLRIRQLVHRQCKPSRDRVADVVAIEAGFVGPNPRIALGLAEVRGAIMTIATGYTMLILEIPPYKARAAVGLKANCGKDAVRRRIAVLFGLNAMPTEDEADAAAIAVAAAEMYGFRLTARR